jgi:hypothetical protein
VSLWSLVAFLLLVYVATAFGPPPPSARGLAVFALLAWAVLPWAAWIERTRDVRDVR